MSASTAVTEIVRGWTAPERDQALAEIVRNLVRDDKKPILIEDIGLLLPLSGESHVVRFDDSTAFLKEMRRRSETPEESDLIMELDLPIPEEEQPPES